jgi:hypothetical protein
VPLPRALRIATGGITEMKALVPDEYGSAEVLEFRDIDKPESGDNEALVRGWTGSARRGAREGAAPIDRGRRFAPPSA